MAKACKQVELTVRVDQRHGSLGQVLAEVAAHGVNILAYCTYLDHNDLVLLLVADDPVRAKQAIQTAGYPCKANQVVLVTAADQVGAAAQLGAHLGQAGVDILYSYASSAGGNEFFAVFKTVNDERALQVLGGADRRQAAA